MSKAHEGNIGLKLENEVLAIRIAWRMVNDDAERRQALLKYLDLIFPGRSAEIDRIISERDYPATQLPAYLTDDHLGGAVEMDSHFAVSRELARLTAEDVEDTNVRVALDEILSATEIDEVVATIRRMRNPD